ncbi:Polar-differentiation response regulator DivK [Thermoflexales bacterium]|nr:Polar-differentiation response regulator DivK [Thermoflexales bacterium]
MSKILIVEDNALNRALLLAVLKTQGFEILSAENGLQGLELARRELPDLILMDVMLPGLNGYEATRRLKAELLTRHIPIIAVTANAAPAERERALDAGCDGYIAKPIDTRTLPGQVRLFLR